jgi:PilZ domain
VNSFISSQTRPSAATGIAGSPAPEKRASRRYKCEGIAELQTDGVDMGTKAKITDISLSGCYVEVSATSAVNTFVNMVLTVKGIRLALKGVVRTSFPLLGMGIEFAEIRDEDKAALQAVLVRLDKDKDETSAFDVPETEVSPQAPEVLMIMDSGAALNALAKFFQDHQSLSRDQFTDVISRSQDLSYQTRFDKPGVR